MRPYAGAADQAAMLALAQATRADNVHVADLPYRLAAWAFDYPDNVGLWEDGAGVLIAWAVLNSPFWTLDYAYTEAARDLGLGPAILTWAVRRATALAGQPNGRPLWLVSVRADQADRRGDLERTGFVDQAGAAENAMSQVLLVRPAGGLATIPALPTGFTMRPLAGPAETAACATLHRAAFDSPNMTDGWRARLLATPGYRPDLDLVVAAPDGQLAAYCLGWLDPTDPAGPLGQIEPLAGHPAFAGLGLGRAVLAETLRRLYALGATRVLVETDSYREAAQNVYAQFGFTLQHEIRVYRRDFPTPA
jgi:ribosomal protein S18 acetylase RimI-like enzyme